MILAAQPGTIVDRGYRLHEQLGEGGMGAVYRATNLVTGEAVALKLVSTRLLADTQKFIEQSVDLHERLNLAREFQTLASLHHPNIIRVLSYGFDEKLDSYFTMELLKFSKTILEFGAEHSDEGKVQLIAQLLRALTYIHRRGVIHRDIKPGNVLVVGDEVKLLDFGIATNTAGAADLAGTLDYMAPELLLGEAPSARSDLYAVGVIFHQLLTGRFPNKTDSMTALLEGMLGDDSEQTTSPTSGQLPSRVMHSRSWSNEPLPSHANILQGASATLDADSPVTTHQALSQTKQLAALPALDIDRTAEDIPEPLGGIIRRLLQKDPSQRYDSAQSVLRDLAACAQGELPIETAATRESFLQASVLIGREVELAELTGALKKLASRVGAAYLLGGESGVGKSRLISELRTLSLVRGCWAADGQSVSDGGFLYQEWLPLLRSLCFQVVLSDEEASLFKPLIPNIESLIERAIPDPPPVKPEASLVRLANSIVGLLKRLTKPLLLILEDLHWGRSESLALLAQITQSVAQLPILIVGTYRSDESPNLPQRLPGVSQMQLNRLQRRDIEQLSESMLGPVGQQPKLIDYLVRQTEGNVFFAVEIVRALAEGAGELDEIGRGELPENLLTEGIGQIVARRVDHVSIHYRPLLEFSATLGRKLDPAALQLVFPEISLRDFFLECSNAAVLESQGSDWRFAHDKLRESIIQRLDKNRRALLNLQVAETLERLYTGKARDAFVAALAHHYQQAGVPEKAFKYYLQAGDSAAKIYAYEQARHYYAACLDLLDQLPQETDLRRLRVDVLIKQIQSSLTSTAPDINQERIVRARALLDAINKDGVSEREDRRRMARLDYYCARLYHYSGQPGKAMALYGNVLPIAQEFQDQELILVPSLFLGPSLALQGQVTRAVALLEKVAAPMEQLFGRDIDTLRAYLYLSVSLGLAGRYGAALRHFAHVLPWLTESQPAIFKGTFYALSGVTMCASGDWPAAIKASESALTFATECNEPLLQYLSFDTNAAAQSQLGNHESALINRRRAVEIRRLHGGGIIKDWYDAVEAEIYLNAGRFEDAVEQARRVAEKARLAGTMVSLTRALRTWGSGLAQLGAAPEEVHVLLQESLTLANNTGLLVEAIRTELTFGQICQRRGDLGAAEHHFSQAREQMTAEMGQYPLGEWLRFIELETKS